MSSFTMPYPIAPAFKKPTVLEEQIAIMQWCLAYKSPPRQNLRHIIIDVLQNKPQANELQKQQYRHFCMLATAVSLRYGYDQLASWCFQEWKSLTKLKTARITSDPQIRRLLDLDPPPFLHGTGWIRHNWELVKAWYARVFVRKRG